MGDFMMNFSGDDSVITYLRQQKLMLLELVLLMLSIMILALEGAIITTISFTWLSCLV